MPAVALVLTGSNGQICVTIPSFSLPYAFPCPVIIIIFFFSVESMV